MVCSNFIKGRGILYDSKYPGEKHVPGYSFLGPGSRLDIRTTGPDYAPNGPDGVPINNLDALARQHDISYDKIKKEYNITHDKNEGRRKINKVDAEFINKARNEGLTGKMAASLIALKSEAENSKLLPTDMFSGFGKHKKHDPIKKLRQEAQGYKKVSGGMLPFLIPIGVAMLTTLATKIVGDVYEKVKQKVSGNGILINHPTIHKKRQFLIKMLK